MSMEQHEDALFKRERPRFTKNINKLNIVFDEVEPSGANLEEIGKSIQGFLRLTHLVTSDGYDWFVGMMFVGKADVITVAFPMTRDQEKRDGVQNDRSIALYTDLSEGKELTELVQTLITALYNFKSARSE